MPDADELGTAPGGAASSAEGDTAGVPRENGESGGSVTESDSQPIDADEVLLAAVDVARTALLDITPADTIGAPIGHIVEGEHVLSLLFECTMAGYPGWRWTVSMSRIDENSEPFVLETELMPGEQALLAPEWVPWSDRLADYRGAQDAAAALALADPTAGTDDDLDELDDDDDIDDDDTDDDDTDDELEEDDHIDDELDDDIDTELDGDVDPFGDALDGEDDDFDGVSATPKNHPREASESQDDSEHGAP